MTIVANDFSLPKTERTESSLGVSGGAKQERCIGKRHNLGEAQQRGGSSQKESHRGALHSTTL